MDKKGSIFLTILIMFFLFGILALILGVHIPTTENGEHTGYVTAIETNGLIFKTDRVYFKTDTESTQEDTYCILDKELESELRNYQENKTRITVEYMSWFSYGIKYCKGEEGIITGIKINA